MSADPTPPAQPARSADGRSPAAPQAQALRNANGHALGVRPPGLLVLAPNRRPIAGLVIAMAAAAGEASAADLALAWDPVLDPRVALYQVQFGPASGNYGGQVETAEPAVVLRGLVAGRRYYIAVRACESGGATCGGFSNELSATPADPAPLADIAVVPGSGAAPLTVDFSDRSVGAVERWSWDFGDGTGASVPSPRHTYTAVGTYAVSLTVTGPGGSSRATRPDPIRVLPAPPVAAFVATRRVGVVPFTTIFADRSEGQVAARDWAFGDGGASTAAIAVHTYRSPGTYGVTLTVSGPGGSDAQIKPAFIAVKAPPAPVGDQGKAALEFGQVTVDQQWRRFDFRSKLAVPIVIAKPLRCNAADPAVVRVTGIDPNGFWARVQGWDALDGALGSETVNYLVIERGQRRLANGAWIEAGSLQTDADARATATYSAPFPEVPVVLAAVNSDNEADPVAIRLQAIDTAGLRVDLKGRETTELARVGERIDFVAWQPSAGTIDGRRYEAGRTRIEVTPASIKIPATWARRVRSQAILA